MGRQFNMRQRWMEREKRWNLKLVCRTHHGWMMGNLWAKKKLTKVSTSAWSKSERTEHENGATMCDEQPRSDELTENPTTFNFQLMQKARRVIWVTNQLVWNVENSEIFRLICHIRSTYSPLKFILTLKLKTTVPILGRKMWKIEKRKIINHRLVAKVAENNWQKFGERKQNSCGGKNKFQMWKCDYNLKQFVLEYKLRFDCYPASQQFYNPFESSFQFFVSENC